VILKTQLVRLMLKLSKELFQQLVEEAKKQKPLEACGLLAGKNNTVLKFYPMTNEDQSRYHYSMDPTEQFTVLKDIQKRGWDILAIWHSHPDTPPRMSEEDKRLALMPEVNYAILSLAKDFEYQLKAFFKDTNGEFIEQEVSIAEEGVL